MAQNLNERDAVMALDELNGRQTIHQMCDHLEARGLFPDDEDILRHAKLDITRGFAQKSRRYHAEKGETQLEWTHLFEDIEQEDGSKERLHYWKKCEDMIIGEAIQDLGYRRNAAAREMAEFHRKYQYYAKKFGKRNLQRKLPFDMPPEDVL